MYYCENCGSTFEEPNRKEIYAEDYLGIGTMFPNKTRIDLLTCPHCDSENYEEMERCEICGEYFKSDQLEDTEGYINGGCGYCCEQCIDDADMIRI